MNMPPILKASFSSLHKSRQQIAISGHEQPNKVGISYLHCNLNNFSLS
jgi:hypothetical protein